MKRGLLGATIAFGAVISGCASGPASQPALSSARASDAPAASRSASATVAMPSIATVSANNATNAELIAAFTAAGIPNPSSWAREVQEYRPYDTSDTNLAKLRQNLAKYNPAPGVVDKIVAALRLP